MTNLADLIEPIKEMAVVAAMNLGASAFNIPRPAGGTDAAKQELKALVQGSVTGSTMTLVLDEERSIAVAPLYIVFSAAWSQPQLRLDLLERLKRAPVLQGVEFDLKLQGR